MIPNIKLYLDIAAAVAVAVFIGWFVHHERETGRQEIINADAKVVAATVQHNADAEELARLHTAPAVAAYQSSISVPVNRPISVRLCIPTLASGTSAAANDAGAGSSDHGGPGLPDGVGPKDTGAEIGPLTDQLFAEATAQVRALRAYIRACQEEGVCRGQAGQ